MTAQDSTDSTAGSVISLPKGGGAVGGLGETFAPDLFSGTGNYSVPITVPAGRGGLQPRLSLTYSTGGGRGPFGLGWQLNVPGVTRKTSKGVPRYRDADVFVLSGTEDLVPVAGASPGRMRYRPRTEGLFARIEHVQDATGDFWEVYSKDGRRTRYGALVADPAQPAHVFGWRITETADPSGNLIRYDYARDAGEQGQPLLTRISYGDYGDPADPSFLITVDLEYEPRPDPFSDHRAGFEIRTSSRCTVIRVTTHAADGVARVQRETRLGYTQAGFNGASLLTAVAAAGIDGPATESLPPLTFGYSGFDPAGRRFEPVTGPGLPTGLSGRTLTLADLRGIGLPDVVQLDTTARFWRNAGGGRFESPRTLTDAPPFALGSAGVQLMDADGDGRPDLVVTQGPAAGYFPMTFAGAWSRRTFQPYRQVPGVDLASPSVKLIDLDGDGLTDVLRSGTRLQAWFNDPDPRLAWQRTVADGAGPDVDLADPRIRMADMTGDGLSDIVLLRSGAVVYWPNLGHGRWGARVTMRNAPRLPDGYDPRRLLLGDVDGDGAADLVYVDDGRILVWGNRSGNGWTAEPVLVRGTPLTDSDAIDLVDLHGTGVAGLLYSRGPAGAGRDPVRFLDLTGGVKPYLLTSTDNHMGARTTVTYRPSTGEYLRDAADPATRWRTTLPFPVQVVTGVRVDDLISGGRLTTEYRYHHGYWDGVEREFRGFAMVERLDTETFGDPDEHFAPPTLTKTWFHPGPVAAVEAGDWTELDLTHEYWPGDAPKLERPAEVTAFLAGLSRADRRGALRAMRGHVLRTEVYARDDGPRRDRPYTVTESVTGVRPEAPGVTFAFTVATRTTEWERGDDPMTLFSFSDSYDAYGFATRQLSVAVPRGRDPMTADAGATEPYLATCTTTEYSRRDDAGHYLVDRIARTTTSEVGNDGRPSVAGLRDAVLSGSPPVDIRVVTHVRTYYDGDAFVGLPLGTLGDRGLPTRAERLAFTDGFLDGLFRSPDPAAVTPFPVYLVPGAAPAWTGDYPAEFRAGLPTLAGYRHYAASDVPGSPGGYYIATDRHRYDARGLPVSSLDPLGGAGSIEYDAHDLLPARSVDAAGLAIAAVYDYRVLAPLTVVDANGNAESVTYSPAALVTAHYRRGRAGEGDRDVPSVRFSHDLTAFADRGQPVSTRTDRRVQHDTDPGASDDVIVSVVFSDGSGRIVQTRTQSEDTLFGDGTFGHGVLPADQLADSTGPVRPIPSTVDNVVVDGWQVYDNKGRVVHRFEPFFATGYAYAEPAGALLGQAVTRFYDPRGHVVRTVHPDGSEQRVVFGVPVALPDPDRFVPTPWESYTYDANDNAGRTDPDGSAGYRSHWNTPSSLTLDALGRAVRGVSRLGPAADDPVVVTGTVYDIQGNLIATVDPLGRQALRFTVDLAGRRWRVDGLDSGRRDTVPDAAGLPVEGRDSKGSMVLATYDVLRRVSRQWARDDLSAPTLRQRCDYGDGGTADQPAAERDAARAANLLGRLARHHDEAGLVTTTSVDFKGNVLDKVRQVIADGPILATYQAAAVKQWQVVPFRVDWTARPGQTPADREAELLDANRKYRTTTAYDALNRVTRRRLPSDVDGKRAELVAAYNRSGALNRVTLNDTVHVGQIGYDAKGQRTLIAYGNGILSRYAYDLRTARLVRLRTEHYTLTGTAYQPGGEVVQDYGYTYDLAGNVLTVLDITAGSGVQGNPDALAESDPVLRDLVGRGQALRRRFSYDALYRLGTASGREHQAPPADAPWLTTPRGTDSTRAQSYVEAYAYDALDNLLTLKHGATGGFARVFTLAGGSNRLTNMRIGTTDYGYAFDVNGNLVSEATTRQFRWNHADRLVAFGNQTPGAEPSVHAQYLYDATGTRVTKLVRRQGGTVEVTHYIDGLFEHHRWSKDGANNVIQVMDDQKRIAMVRVGPAHPDDRGPATAFHLGDHLGSSVAVLDGTGAVTNREEYTPFGETSFGSYARKRYRFTGKERDEESGLAYHQARYLMSWLGRWAGVDPLVFDEQATTRDAGRRPNPYGYCNAMPTGAVDPDGRDVHILVDTSGRDIDYAAVATRGNEIEHSSSFDPAKDAVYRLQVLDLGQLKGQIDAVRADAATRGFGPTVELSVWGHAHSDGPVGSLPTSGPDMVDKKQLSMEGWNKIDFGWRKDSSFAAFYGCSASSFAQNFFNAQKSKGLTKAGYFDTASYPSLSPTSYVRDRNGWGVTALAEDIRKGKLTVGKDLGVWYMGIEKWDHRANTWTGSSVNVHPMQWVTQAQWWVPPSSQPAPAPAPAPVRPQPPAKPVPVRSGGVWL